MKVIVINDSDGHTNVLNCTVENLKKMLGALIESDMDCDDPEQAQVLIDGSPSIEELIEFVTDTFYSVNSRGGMCHILDVRDWEFHHNPLQ